jgi:hypothetical protein
MLVAIYAGSVFKTHLRRLGSLRHQSKMNFASTSKVFFDPGDPQIPPNPPVIKGGNYRELLLKSPFEKGGFRGI